TYDKFDGEPSLLTLSIMPVRLFTIVLALNLAACVSRTSWARGPPGGTVIRFTNGDSRQTCTVAWEANERILSTFAIGPGAPSFLKRRIGRGSNLSGREPGPNSFSRVLKSEHSRDTWPRGRREAAMAAFAKPLAASGSVKQLRR